MQKLQRFFHAAGISVSISMTVITLAPLAVSLIAGCSDSFMRSTVSDKRGSMVSLQANVDAAGNVTGAFDPSSGATQTLRISSGSLAGAAVAIPPGALSLSLSITVGEGETLAASSFTQQIGLSDNTISAGGPSVSFIPSSNVQASNPFTLSLPLALTSLALDSSSTENLVVMYRWMKVVNGETSYVMGVIPRDEVTIAKDKVSFQTDKFGVFQVGIAQTKITQKISVPTVEPPALKGDATNPLVGNWGMCRVDDTGNTQGPQVFPPRPIPTPNPSTGFNSFDNQLVFTQFQASTINGASLPLQVLSGIRGGQVKALAYYESGTTKHLYVGGSFGATGNVSNTNRLGRLNLVTKSWEQIATTDLITDSNAEVKSLLAMDNQLLVAGKFGSTERIFSIPLNSTTPAKIAINPPTYCDSVVAMKVDMTGNPAALYLACDNLTAPFSRVFRGTPPIPPSTSWYWYDFGATGFNGGEMITGLELSDKLVFVGTSAGRIGALPKGATTQAWELQEPFSSSSVSSLSSTTTGDVFIAGRQSVAPNSAVFMKMRRLSLNCSSTSTNFNCSYQGVTPFLSSSSKIWVADAPSSSGLLGRSFSSCTISVSGSPTTTAISCSGSFSSNTSDSYKIVYTAGDTASPKLETSFSSTMPPKIHVFGDFLHVLSSVGISRYNLNFGPANPDQASTMPGFIPDVVLATPAGIFAGGLSPNSGCNSIDLTPPAATVAISPAGVSYKLLVELDGQAPTEAYSGWLSSGTIEYTGIPAATWGAPNAGIGRTVKLKTPTGCFFKFEKTVNGTTTSDSFKDFNVENQQFERISGGVCKLPYIWQSYGNIMNLKIICDGSNTGSQGGGGNQSGGGNDSFGAAPGVQYSVREGIKITAGNFLHIKSRFKSTDCTGGMASNLTESGTYTLPTSDDTNSILINGLTTKVMGSLLSDDSVAAANQAPQFKGCGLNGWVKGTPRDLSTTGCAELKPFYGRFKVDGGKLIICGMGEDTYAPASECAGSNTKIFQKLP